MPSKKDQISETIRTRIRQGTYSDKIPGERSLAAEFGMDFKTVNRAIGELVDEGILVRRRGLGTFIAPVDERPEVTLGLCCYKYNDPGRDPVFTRLFAGVNRAAKAHRLRLDVTNLLEVTADSIGPEEAAQRFEQTCLATDPDALIYLGNMDLGLIQRLRNRRPLVVVGQLPPTAAVDSIRRDIAGGTAEAVRRLAADGHQHIAFATYAASADDYDLHAKEAGYRRAIEELALEPLVVVQSRAAAGKLPERIAKSAPRPTAVVCSESTLGLALTRADGQELELTIVSFDDGDIGAVTRPPMHSIHAFGEELGILAVERLLERLSGERSDPIDELLPCPIVERVPNLS